MRASLNKSQDTQPQICIVENHKVKTKPKWHEKKLTITLELKMLIYPLMLSVGYALGKLI